MKKIMSTALLVSLTMALIVGCSGAKTSVTQQPDSGGKKEAQAAKKDVTVKLTIWGNENYKKQVEDAAKDFNVKYPNIKVDVMLIPITDYPQKLSIMIASKTAPDLAWMNYRIAPQFIEANQLADVAADLKKDPEYNFADQSQAGFVPLTRGDKIYGAPFLNMPKVLFFNKTLFKEKGLKNPLELYKEGNWTYEEFLKAAKAISDPSKGIYGANLVTANGWKAWPDTLIDTIWAYGGDFISADGKKLVMNTPEGEKALQLFSDMMFKDQIHPKPGDQTTFESGKIGMNRHNYGYVDVIRKNVTNFEWDVAPMPKGPVKDAPVADGLAGYSILQDSKHKEEALLFLKYMTGNEGMKKMASLFVPNRMSVLESGALTDGFNAPSKEGIKAAVIGPLSPGGSKTAPSHNNWQQIDVKTQTILDMLYTKSASVKDVLNKMETEINPLLK
ncbi:ABC transporter substrate-binding protein [Paenibacillus alginolyticus]|uniref:Sugar ABC transporter substrate-binding protein n=1 Tax=Paenibacillus alginolyticus TaxID=59839 RepID=A0ABT4GPP7_9BACL|nr:sugar ABC transporter substrate-binding protein [Paenibacillus alginolyticus]MCY9698179.1 sugar ABC transporter substrate-binding protein [Paenibacillus alginolyticus]MEC0146725.1 sugar ABC transporter substrate-binding protein [Paenibacillus alginolyticus]